MISRKNQVIKLCGVHNLVCGFSEVTRVALVRGFGGVPFCFNRTQFIYFLSCT